jgi:hypothetical protein
MRESWTDVGFNKKSFALIGLTSALQANPRKCQMQNTTTSFCLPCPDLKTITFGACKIDELWSKWMKIGQNFEQRNTRSDLRRFLVLWSGHSWNNINRTEVRTPSRNTKRWKKLFFRFCLRPMSAHVHTCVHLFEKIKAKLFFAVNELWQKYPLFCKQFCKSTFYSCFYKKLDRW